MQKVKIALRNTSFGVFLNLFLLAFFVCSCYCFSMTLNAQEPASVDVLGTPESVETQVGSNFTITVHIDPDGGLVTVADIRMSFNPAMVQVQSVAFAPGTPLNIQNQPPVIDNENGNLQYGGFNFTPTSTAFDHIVIECTAVGSGMSFFEHVRVGSPTTLMAYAGFDVTDETPAIPINITINDADCPELGVNNGDPCEVDGQDGEFVNCECLPFDCDGVPGGSAAIDDCGLCTGGTTGLEPNDTCLDCEGTPNGPAMAGEPCVVNEVIGIWDENCQCLPSYDCPELMANIGDACDDGNESTENDVITEDCECAGEEPETGNLEGSANWNSNCGPRELVMNFYEPGTAALVLTKVTSIDENGDYSIGDIPVNSYDIYAKIEGQLANGFFNEMIESGNNSLFLEAFIPGDLNNNNGININDFSMLNVSFGSSTGDANFNYLADMNCDGNVNIIDVSILNAGFGLVGAQP